MRSSDDEIIEFLIKPKNIETTYDIWESFGKARNRLVINFWQSLIEETEQRLQAAQQSNFWNLVQGWMEQMKNGSLHTLTFAYRTPTKLNLQKRD